MKKYISILSLLTALFLYSCERSDSDLNATQQNEAEIAALSIIESAKNQNKGSQGKVSDNMQIGDDEPPRDKQHWKIVKDTIW